MWTTWHSCDKNEGVIMYKMYCDHHNCTECIDKDLDMSLPLRLFNCKCWRKTLIN
jgi:hypothetical protein